MNTSTTPTAAPRTWRMFDWLIAALLLAVLVYLIAPQQLPVSLYKLSLVALAAVAGYWIDRSIAPYGRPDDWIPKQQQSKVTQADGSILVTRYYTSEIPLLFGLCMLRRAIIIAAAMIAMGLGA